MQTQFAGLNGETHHFLLGIYPDADTEAAIAGVVSSEYGMGPFDVLRGAPADLLPQAGLWGWTTLPNGLMVSVASLMLLARRTIATMSPAGALSVLECANNVTLEDYRGNKYGSGLITHMMHDIMPSFVADLQQQGMFPAQPILRADFQHLGWKRRFEEIMGAAPYRLTTCADQLAMMDMNEAHFEVYDHEITFYIITSAGGSRFTTFIIIKTDSDASAAKLQAEVERRFGPDGYTVEQGHQIDQALPEMATAAGLSWERPLGTFKQAEERWEEIKTQPNTVLIFPDDNREMTSWTLEL